MMKLLFIGLLVVGLFFGIGGCYMHFNRADVIRYDAQNNIVETYSNVCLIDDGQGSARFVTPDNHTISLDGNIKVIYKHR